MLASLPLLAISSTSIWMQVLVFLPLDGIRLIIGYWRRARSCWKSWYQPWVYLRRKSSVRVTRQPGLWSRLPGHLGNSAEISPGEQWKETTRSSPYNLVRLCLFKVYSESFTHFVNRLCIQAPREGSRVEQTGDEKLLSLAQECEINANPPRSTPDWLTFKWIFLSLLCSQSTTTLSMNKNT